MRGPLGLICSDNGREVEVALKGIDVNVSIGHMISHVESVLLYKNTRQDAIETLFKFPLDEGSAVYKFEAEIDGKIIVAECQEKQQAQKTYDEAKQSGHTAFLLKEDDDSGDIFMCYLGNLPSQKEARLTVAYVSELWRETNRSLKFTLPMVLNPRYKYLNSQQNTNVGPSLFGFQNPYPYQRPEISESGKGNYSFSLNINIQSQFQIDSIISEASEIAVEIEEPDRVRAKVSYAAEKCDISTDVALLIQYKEDNQPTAILERGSSGQDGLMKSDILLLNFYPELQESCRKSGEFIFVIDRSGSMQGHNILSATQTLMLLVKSLRVGCYFNIVSFGSTFVQLFPQSVIYNKENMTSAVNLVNTMNADMGGTELLKPLEKIFSDPVISGHPRQLFVITDGEIVNVNQTLDLVKKNSKNSRVFSVGIGQGASTALVKGLARAGNGRCEFVQGEDRLQQKVMSLMKFSLQPEIENLTLEWTLSAGVDAVTIPQELTNLFVGEMVTLYAIITGAERQEIVGGTVKLCGKIRDAPFEYLLEFEGHGYFNDTTVAAPIHRLAAKALVKDLEIEEMAIDGKDKKSEIVLISVSANIVSKYTSFVGVDKDSKVPVPQVPKYESHQHGYAQFGSLSTNNAVLFGAPMSNVAQFGSLSTHGVFGSAMMPMPAPAFSNTSYFGGGTAKSPSFGFGGFGGSAQGVGFGSGQQNSSLFASATGFGGSAQGAGFGSGQQNSSFFASGPPLNSIKTQGNSLFGSGTAFGMPGRGMFGGGMSGFGVASNSVSHHGQKQGLFEDDVIAVVSLQDFEGSWECTERLIELLKISDDLTKPPDGINQNCWVTILVLAWLECKHDSRKDEWELIYKKAYDWATAEIGADTFSTLKALALNAIK